MKRAEQPSTRRGRNERSKHDDTRNARHPVPPSASSSLLVLSSSAIQPGNKRESPAYTNSRSLFFPLSPGNDGSLSERDSFFPLFSFTFICILVPFAFCLRPSRAEFSGNGADTVTRLAVLYGRDLPGNLAFFFKLSSVNGDAFSNWYFSLFTVCLARFNRARGVRYGGRVTRDSIRIFKAHIRSRIFFPTISLYLNEGREEKRRNFLSPIFPFPLQRRESKFDRGEVGKRARSRRQRRQGRCVREFRGWS